MLKNFFCVVIFLFSSVAFCTTYFVKKGGSDDNTGLDWNNAFLTITKALDVSATGDSIWVAEGVFKEGNTIEIGEDVSIFGGFIGNEQYLNQRNIKNYKTIINGEERYRCITNCGLVDGLYITNGFLNENDGGGIYNCGNLTNCCLYNNNADKGSGIYNEKGIISNSRLLENLSFSYNGGCIYNNQGEIINSIVYCNAGSGIVNDNGLIKNSTIYGNQLYGIDNNNGIVKNCISWKNHISDVQIYGYNYTGNITYSCFREAEGEDDYYDNINCNPRFQNIYSDISTWDFHLQNRSKCIDNGNPTGAPKYDIEGKQRPGTDGKVCIGAFESPDFFSPPSSMPSEGVSLIKNFSYRGYKPRHLSSIYKDDALGMIYRANSDQLYLDLYFEEKSINLDFHGTNGRVLLDSRNNPRIFIKKENIRESDHYYKDEMNEWSSEKVPHFLGISDDDYPHDGDVIIDNQDHLYIIDKNDYYNNKTGEWETQVLDLYLEEHAIDHQGNMHIIGRRYESDRENWYYTTNKTGSWKYELLYKGPAPPDNPNEWPTDPIYENPQLDLYPNGDPIIIARYYQRARTGSVLYSQLRCLRRSAYGTWMPEVIADSSDNFYGSDGDNYTGYNHQLFIDDNSCIHVIFSDGYLIHDPHQESQIGQIRYAFNNGQGWKLKTILPESTNPDHKKEIYYVGGEEDWVLADLTELRDLNGSSDGRNLFAFAVRIEKIINNSHEEGVYILMKFSSGQGPQLSALAQLTSYGDVWGAGCYGLPPFENPRRWGWLGYCYDPAAGKIPLTGDFDGDGFLDLIQINPVPDNISSCWVSINSGDTFKSPKHWGYFGFTFEENDIPGVKSRQICTSDVNGDGKSDLLMIDVTGNAWVAVSTGNGFGNPELWGCLGFSFSRDLGNGIGTKVLTADFNGDGIDDVAQLTKYHDIWVSISTGRGFTDPQRWGWIGFTYAPKNGLIPLTGDFNGDGLTDIAQTTPYGDIWVATSNRDDFSEPSRWGWLGFHYDENNNYLPLVGDVNNDGKTDLIQITPYGDPWVAFSGGWSFDNPDQWGWLGFKWSKNENRIPFFLGFN